MIDYSRIPDYPESVSATNTISRLVDALGFRFYWATEGLEKSVSDFRPCDSAWSIYEIMGHIWELINWVNKSMYDQEVEKPESLSTLRQNTLELISRLRGAFGGMQDEELAQFQIKGCPFWNVINGPIADALTHVGQIHVLRRMAGSPSPKADVFRGLPPG